MPCVCCYVDAFLGVVGPGTVPHIARAAAAGSARGSCTAGLSGSLCGQLCHQRAYLSEKGAVTMKFCEYCGKAFDDDCTVCPNCGAQLRPLQDRETEENALTVEEMLLLGLL